MLINTYVDLPEMLTKGISTLSRAGLSATLLLIGAGLSADVIRKVGMRPLVLGVALWAVISVLSLTAILAM